jgi:peptidoglycan-associated lipoprotein
MKTQSVLKVVAMSAVFTLAACSSKPEPVKEMKKIVPTATPAPVVEMTKMPEIDPSIALDAASTVYFDFDQSDVKAESAATLAVHVAYLTENAGAMVSLQGHADERGTREYNLALGEKRAQAAKDYLVSMGVDAAQLNTVSLGEEQKEVENAMTDSEHAQNRRVVVFYKTYK